MGDLFDDSVDPFSTLVDILRWRATRQLDSTAYTFLLDGEDNPISLTYGELDRQARAIAAALQSRYKAGERALLLYPSGLEFVAGFLGCLYAGVVAVPAYPPRHNRNLLRLQAIATDAGVSVALTTRSMMMDIERQLKQSDALSSLQLISADNLSTELAEQWQKPALSSDSLAFLQYTSGSTGKPKGVMVNYGNLLHNQRLIKDGFGHTDKSIVVGWLPLFHDMGLIGNMLQPLYLGFHCILMSPVAFIQKPFRWLQAISHYKATTSGGPNFAYDLCVQKITPEQREQLELSSWEVAFNGAEPVRAGTLERFTTAFESCGFRKEAFYPCYGMAEATLIITGGEKTVPPVVQDFAGKALEQNMAVAATGSERITHKLVGCGCTWLDAKIIIVDPETRIECSAGQVGEIWTSSLSVAQGYWKNSVETEQTFCAYLANTGEGPFLRTGDLGFVWDGELFIAGRRKDLIIIRGRNYYPQDIELTVEESHPALSRGSGAVFSIEAEGEERLIIVQEVVRSSIRKLDIDEVVGAIRRAVSEQNDLQVYAVLLLKTGRIPKTSSGKIQRHACKAGFLAGNLDVIGEWRQHVGGRPQSLTAQNHETQVSPQQNSQNVRAIEAWLAAKIAQRLNIAPEAIDIREPFARYGLDSLAAVGLSGELEEWLERKLSPTIAYDYPTIEALARYLAAVPESKKAAVAISADRRDEREAIAIIGIGCRFPGAKNPEEFWKLLRDGVDAITEVPPDRWNVDAFYDPTPGISGKMNTRWGGFLEDVDKFEPEFFGISPREVESMDPQQRLVLEVSWEALENAGQAPDKLVRSKTGVFIGISNNDYSRLQFNSPSDATTYAGTGNALSIAANRLSYLLDLRGPSLAIDTACSSSLVAVHQACQSLRHGECNMALAGGVNLILSPALTIIFSQAQMLAADGRCKTFDASADGYVRGEGCGIVILKRLSDALRDGNKILATIRGSAVNHDGRTNGLTAPNGQSQQEVIHEALTNANVAPHHISYVESHGTGTSLGDPIELNSLKEVLLVNRLPEQTCLVGCVKTNIGHLEAAAGVAGLIKLVLSLQNREIPPHLHFTKLNPHISLENTPFSIPIERQKWIREDGLRLGGISSFGFGGTNAHVIVEEAPAVKAKQSAVERPLHLLTLSAKSEEALRDLADRYAKHLGEHPSLDIGNVCFTAATGRSHFEHRLAVRAGSVAEMQDHLAAAATGAETAGAVCGRASRGKRPKVAFLFSGQGSQYVEMGRQLYETQPTFRNNLELCDEILRPYLRIPLRKILYPTPDMNSLLSEIAYTQPTLFALEYSLAELWKSWGVEPDAVMGHSLGEYVAACTAGVFRLEDGLKLIAERARLMQALPQDGEMAAVFADEARVSAAILPYGNEVSIAAINGPESVVISGRREAVRAITMLFKEQGITSKPLNVSHAFHSPLMEPMLAVFESVAHTIAYSAPTLPIISNVTGKEIGEEIATAEYWRDHIRRPVRFAESIETLQQQGYDIFLEVGPKPILLGMGRECLPSGYGAWLPSLGEGYSDWQQMLESLGELYVHGVPIDWRGFDRDYVRQKVALPTYPFQRQRYWVPLIEQRPQDNVYSPTVARDHSEEPLQNLLYEVEWIVQGRQNQKSSSSFVPDLPELENYLRQRCDQLTSAANTEIYEEVLGKIEALSSGYILKAFQEMGWRFRKGHIFLLDEIMKDLGIGARYKKLVNRLLEILTEEGVLRQIGKGWETVLIPTFQDPTEQNKALLALYPMAISELTLLDRCGSNLARILQGKCDPIQLLFPEGDFTSLTMLYQDSPGAKVMNTLIQEAVFKAMDKLPDDHVLRILEIGGGTGGTTSYILPLLSTKQTEYIFTDISPVFLTEAQKKFAGYPFVQYQVLDIEQLPSEQGIELNKIDLIIAANVLHATKDLRQTLNHVQQILKPGGMLVLLEGTAPQRWLDLIFGLMEGWWRFSDIELRPSYPLLSVNRWQTFLEEMGFKQTVAVSPDQERKGILSQQAVILAQIAQARPKKSISAARRWLVFADRRGVGKELIALLRSRGDLCTLVLSGKAYKRLSKRKYVIDPSSLADTERLFKEYREEDPSALHGVVHLWSLDLVSPESLTVADLESISQNGCGSLLHVVQVLIKQGFQTPPSLWVVTQAAQPAGTDPRLPGLAHSVMWGLGKVAALEHPEVKCVRIDLDFDDQINSAQSLFGEICSEAREDQVAFRKGIRYVSRLVNHKHPGTSQQPVLFHEESTYLITGGLGGLGLLVARWLVERGARSIVLVGRSGVGNHTQSQVSELTHKGAAVKVFQADVSDMEQIKTVFANIEKSLPPLRGVIHAAGILDDGIIQQQSWERFAKVFRPKVGGAWNLHLLTSGRGLDFFVMFSSAASLLGSPSQATHAAANAFLDALAYYRQAMGLPGLSINWGAWAKVGAAARKNVEKQMLMRGIGTIEPEEGLKIFEQLLRKHTAQIGVVPIEWMRFLQQFPGGVHPPFFSAIARDLKAQSKIEQPFNKQIEILSSIRDLAPPARFTFLLDYINQAVAKTLRLSAAEMDVHQPLTYMGIDSLMALELTNQLKNDLQVDVPMVKFIEGVSIIDLATLVNQRLFEPVVDESILSQNEASSYAARDRAALHIPEDRVSSQNAREVSAKLDQLSDVEVDALLQKMLSEEEV